MVGEDGELKNLDLNDRLALMERSVIKQSQELQRTKSLFVADLRKADAEIKAKNGQLECESISNRLLQFRLGEALKALRDADVTIPATCLAEVCPKEFAESLDEVLEQASTDLCDSMGEFETKLALDIADMFNNLKVNHEMPSPRGPVHDSS